MRSCPGSEYYQHPLGSRKLSAVLGFRYQVSEKKMEGFCSLLLFCFLSVTMWYMYHALEILSNESKAVDLCIDFLFFNFFLMVETRC